MGIDGKEAFEFYLTNTDNIFEPRFSISRFHLHVSRFHYKEKVDSTICNPQGEIPRAAKVHNKRTLTDIRRCPKL